MELPRSATFRFSNSGKRRANSTNSVVHTGVKSAGWEKRITHLPFCQSESLMGPCVVLASKSGAGPLSSIRGGGSGSAAPGIWDAEVAVAMCVPPLLGRPIRWADGGGLANPLWSLCGRAIPRPAAAGSLRRRAPGPAPGRYRRSEEHTSELQSRRDLVCRLLLEKKKKKINTIFFYKKKNKKKTD